MLPRRTFVASVPAAIAAVCARLANARIGYAPGTSPPSTSAAVVPEVLISYGQSWRANNFDSFALPFGFNQQAQTLLSPLVASIGTPTFSPGPLPTGAGVVLPSTISGITGFSSADVFAIGRCAVLAQQLLRVRDGNIPLVPIIEFCAAYPGSTWTSGGGGGLAPGASFTGAIVSDKLTPSGITGGIISPGQTLNGAGIAANSYVLVDNGDGTFKIGVGLTVIAETMTTSAASFVASIKIAAGTGVLMSVVSMNSGTIAASGETLSGGFIPATTTVVSQIDGVAGGVGSYLLHVGNAQTVGSEAMQALGVSWANQLTIIAGIKSVLPSTIGPYLKLKPAVFRSVGYTQGGSVTDTVAAKVADLTAMLTNYDALALPGPGLNFYIGIAAPITGATSLSQSNWGSYVFCRTHAPGQGGTWSGRCFASTPWYPWPFNGTDQIHTGDYGSARHGEFEGYVRHIVQDRSVSWTPLWRPLTGGAITVSGQNITVPFARPTGPEFATGTLSFVAGDGNGISMPTYPQQGFHVQRLSVDLTVTPTISGMNIVLAITETLNPGDVLDISYAMVGPGGVTPGFFSGCGGNLVMTGPASVLFPGKTIDAWAWPFDESVTV